MKTQSSCNVNLRLTIHRKVKNFLLKICKVSVLDVEVKNIKSCRFSDSVCRNCGIVGYLARVCLKSSKLIQPNNTCQARLLTRMYGSIIFFQLQSVLLHPQTQPRHRGEITKVQFFVRHFETIKTFGWPLNTKNICVLQTYSMMYIMIQALIYYNANKLFYIFFDF